MTFSLYQDKSSILKKNSRYVQGGSTEILPNALGWWEKREDIPKNQIDDIPFKITQKYALRPDNISYAVYGRSDLGWLILEYNNIVDINEELIVGVIIAIPSPLRAFSDILTKTMPTIETA